MELIHFNIEKDNTGTEYIRRAERDTRSVVDRLYGINIPAYPYTLDSIGVEIEEQEIVSSEMLLNVSSDVGNTIYHTSEAFHEQLKALYPYLSEEEHKKKHSELMKRYVYSVLGEHRTSEMLSPEREAELYTERGFEHDFVKYRAFKLKEGHAVLKMLMLKRVIFPTCSAFTFSADYEHLYLQDEVNTESYTWDLPVMIDVAEDVYKLLVDYGTLHKTFHSLGDYVKNAYRGTENDIEAGVHNIADALTHILFGFADNDCIRIDVARTGHQHMNKLIEKDFQKRTDVKQTLALAQVVAENVLAQSATQNATGADF